MKSSSVSTFRMKLARIGFGRSCGEAEHKPFASVQPLNTSAAASSYVVCDVVELHETLQGSGDDGAAKKGGRWSPAMLEMSF